VRHQVRIEPVVAAREQRIALGRGRMARHRLAQDEPLGEPRRMAKLPQRRIDGLDVRHPRQAVQAVGGEAIEQAQRIISRSLQGFGQLLRPGVAERCID
jgi:hypothetical protein